MIRSSGHAISVGSRQTCFPVFQLFDCCRKVALCCGLIFFCICFRLFLCVHVLGVCCHLILQRLFHHVIIMFSARLCFACIAQLALCLLLQVFQNINDATTL